MKRTASNLEVMMDMENMSSYNSGSFLSTSERITLNKNLLNKMSRMWNTKNTSLFYKRHRKVVTRSKDTDVPLFAYSVLGQFGSGFLII